MTDCAAKEADSNLTVETAPVYEATQLTKGGNLAMIKLDGQLYVLRITRAGKLILTK